MEQSSNTLRSLSNASIESSKLSSASKSKFSEFDYNKSELANVVL